MKLYRLYTSKGLYEPKNRKHGFYTAQELKNLLDAVKKSTKKGTKVLKKWDEIRVVEYKLSELGSISPQSEDAFMKFYEKHKR